jgi:hypothetical protein
MDAFLSETRDDGETPIAYNRVAGVVVVGNEDGAHHVIGETNAALNDIGYSMPGQNWTYWNKGPGPGEEEWLTTEERDWVDHDRQGVRVQSEADLPSAAGGDRRVLSGLVHWHEAQDVRGLREVEDALYPGRGLE